MGAVVLVGGGVVGVLPEEGAVPGSGTPGVAGMVPGKAGNPGMAPGNPGMAPGKMGTGPGMFEESLAEYGPFFRGFDPVPVARATSRA